MTETPNRDVTVLVVDDEPDIVSLYAAWLEASYNVRRATDGEEALGALDASVDVVLLDRRMPAMTGDEVLDAIRARSADPRVAMITAVEPDPEIVDMPVDDYLVKPVDRRDLGATVEVLIRRRRYDEKSREYFRLAAKRAALESTEANHRDDLEYRTLTERMEELRESIDATLDELGPVDYEAAFRDLD
jgi:DNA-binding response OmpR family regulator